MELRFRLQYALQLLNSPINRARGVTSVAISYTLILKTTTIAYFASLICAATFSYMECETLVKRAFA